MFSHITFVHISSVYLNNFLKARCARILKVKSKFSFTLRNFDRSINITGKMIQILSLHFVQDWSEPYYSDLSLVH